MKHYLIGLDEAGYGPVLGPLVVSAVVFKVPHPRLNLWRALNKTISSQYHPSKISVCDSKRLYQPQRGLKPLETSVLALASLLPRFKLPLTQLTASQFIKELVPASSNLPWCDATQQIRIPLSADLTQINQLASALRQECRTKSIHLDAVHIRTVQPDQFNNGIKQYHNKAELLFDTTAQLLNILKVDYFKPGQRTRIHMDKQGGRTYYQGHLQRLFEPRRVFPLEQTRTQSSYCLDRPAASKHQVGFIQGGETSQFTIALASMFSKYFRELHMNMFNSFWQKHLPRLKPTAGYPQDGRRFIKQILPLSQQLGINPFNFIRFR